ncbi:hypothetical protein ACN28S_35410 [Cystobacter fuscus]
MNARQKNLVTLLATAVVAGGLGLYAYFGVMKPQAERPPAPESPGALFPTDSPEAPGTDGGTPAAPVFTSMSIEHPHARVELELRDGTGASPRPCPRWPSASRCSP